MSKAWSVQMRVDGQELDQGIGDPLADAFQTLRDKMFEGLQRLGVDPGLGRFDLRLEWHPEEGERD